MRHVLCVLFTFFLGWAALAAPVNLTFQPYQGGGNSFSIPVDQSVTFQSISGDIWFYSGVFTGQINLRVNGTPILITQTPSDLGLTDGAIVEYFIDNSSQGSADCLTLAPLQTTEVKVKKEVCTDEALEDCIDVTEDDPAPVPLSVFISGGTLALLPRRKKYILLCLTPLLLTGCGKNSGQPIGGSVACLAASLSAKHYGSQYKYWKLTRYDARGEVTSVSSGVL